MMLETKDIFKKGELNEYLVLLLPYAEINDEIKGFKREIFRGFGPYAGQNSCAHISLLSFFQQEEREEKVIHCIEDQLSSVKPFEVFLSGFEFDTEARSVYVDILNKTSLNDLYHQLRLSLFQELVSLAFLKKDYHPMMKIGHAFSPLQFLKVVSEYQSKPYSNNFKVNRLNVLRRKAPYTVWESLTALPLSAQENELMNWK